MSVLTKQITQEMMYTDKIILLLKTSLEIVILYHFLDLMPIRGTLGRFIKKLFTTKLSKDLKVLCVLLPFDTGSFVYILGGQLVL